MENVTKSIIYGNIYENRYGKFMPVCSSISDRGRHSLIQLPSNPFLIIFTIHLISRNITELLTHLESKKLQSFSLLKRRMLTVKTMMVVIVIKPFKDLEKNYCIFFKNLVFLYLFRHQKCVYRYFVAAVQSSLSF